MARPAAGDPRSTACCLLSTVWAESSDALSVTHCVGAGGSGVSARAASAARAASKTTNRVKR